MAKTKKKIVDVVEDKVEAVVEDIKEEVTEPVGTVHVTFQRWQVALAAAVLTAVLLIIIL